MFKKSENTIQLRNKEFDKELSNDEGELCHQCLHMPLTKNYKI